jgi:hypothetical protein
MAFARVEISEESFREADALLATIPFEVRTKVVQAGLRAAAAPVAAKARRLAPDSVKSGTRDKWSKKLRDQRSNTPQHRKTIGASSVRTYRDSLMAIYVGPIHPAGNLINVIGHSHKEVLWGRSTGRVLPPTKYLSDAAEQTKAQQQAAFVNKVRSETEKLLKGKAKA